MPKKIKPNNNFSNVNNNNYFSLFQTIDDDKINYEIIINKTTKVIISLTTILKCKIGEVHEIFKANNMNNIKQIYNQLPLVGIYGTIRVALVDDCPGETFL